MSVLKINGKKREADKLDTRAKRLLQAMWHGVDQDITLSNGKIIKAGTPMGDHVAARVIGMPGRYLEYWRHQRVFIDALREQGNARRHSEEPTNLATALAIRDHPADSPEDRRVKLAAIATIRVKEPVTAVNVDLSRHTHDNRQQTLVAPAGYVVQPMQIKPPDEK